MSHRFTASITRDGVWFVAQCLEVDIASQGQTLDEALENLREALILRFEDEAPGANIAAAVVVPFDVELQAH